jgi:hypothetical protein
MLVLNSSDFANIREFRFNRIFYITSGNVIYYGIQNIFRCKVGIFIYFLISSNTVMWYGTHVNTIFFFSFRLNIACIIG